MVLPCLHWLPFVCQWESLGDAADPRTYQSCWCKEVLALAKVTIPGTLAVKRREGAGSLPAVEEAGKKIAGIRKVGDEV